MTKSRLIPTIWAPQRECMSRDALRAHQDQPLCQGLHRIHEHVPFYRDLLARHGVSPLDIRGIQDLEHLPFTSKADLRAQVPLGLLAIPRTDVARVHASSGTSGKPTIMAYSRSDLELWAELTARALAASGIGPGTVIHCSYGYGLFTGGLGFQGGAEKLGAFVIPAGSSDPMQQLTLLGDLEAQALLATPTGAHTLMEAARQSGIDPKGLALASGVFGGEAWSEGLRERVESGLGLEAFDTYGLSEIIGPGVSHECHFHDGLHLYEDHFIPEVIDPKTGEVLPMGELGELVLTALTKQAMPVLRYRTGDLTRLDDQLCPCGRSLIRMQRVVGRTSDLLLLGSGRTTPAEVERVLLTLPGTEPHYQIVLGPQPDEARLLFELAEPLHADPCTRRVHERRLSSRLEAVLGITLAAHAVAPRSLPRSMGKATRVATQRLEHG
jgi:phenylacetate-CoA ligase